MATEVEAQDFIDAMAEEKLAWLDEGMSSSQRLAFSVCDSIWERALRAARKRQEPAQQESAK